MGRRDRRSNGILEGREDQAYVLMTGANPGSTSVRILNKTTDRAPDNLHSLELPVQ
jgi:hypothetical protein